MGEFHMFSNIKMEEYMELELSGKMVTKNIVLGYLGTHFMHMRVKETFKCYESFLKF